jgi:alpha-1,3-mannosyltransferase
MPGDSDEAIDRDYPSVASALASDAPQRRDQVEERLNIVHVVRQFHPGIGGMENFVEQLAHQQLASGHHVRVATLDRIFGEPEGRTLPVRETFDGIEIVRVPFAGSVRYPVAPRILRSIRNADLVHVHGVDFFCDFLAATAWLHRKPLILSTHGGFFHTPFLRRFKKLYFDVVTRTALSQFGAVIACSEEDNRRFASVAGRRLTLIQNPVDVGKFAGRADPFAHNLIYFGRLAPNKELRRLIAWFAGLASRGDWRLIVAGRPMGTTVAELASDARSAGVADRVEFHELPTDDELRALISRSSVYCCSSSYEGFGLAPVEAASAGLFPVLSDIPPFRTTLERLQFGLMVNFEDRSSWDDSYDQFEQSLTEFQAGFSKDRIGANVADFGWRRAAHRFEGIYARVLGRSVRRIGSVSVDVLDRETAVATILTSAAERQPLMVAFCNAHTVNVAGRDGQMREALGSAVVLNDGIGADIASRALFRRGFPANLNGTDFVPHLLASAAAQLRVYFLGAGEGVAEAAAREVAGRFPHVRIAGTGHGYFRDQETPSVLQAIRQSGADMVLVAMGQPRQEIWAARHYQELGIPVICVGALFDFLAGSIPRAPAWMRQRRIEWLYRLWKEPRRLGGRYVIGNAAFLLNLFRQKCFGTRI